jgi:hypothetical protein
MIRFFRTIRQNLLAQGHRCPQPLKGRALALHHQEIQLLNELLRADTPSGDGGERGNSLDKL